MPRAGEARPGEPALMQRTTLVRAGIAERVDLVADPRQHDADPVDFYECRLARADLFEDGGAPFRHISSFSTYARWSPVMYCQRISVACRTASRASASRSGVPQCRSTIWYPRSPW